jgi:predicted 3-demethylubiquinone-9 3-methyltransferase (glyoxalase superfamily)
MQFKQKIAPCLWFDDQAEAAVAFYSSIFEGSRVLKVTRYGKAGFEQHQRPEGSVMAIAFELAGQEFTALNGGPIFKFNESISFQIYCANQAEVDRYWGALTEGGDPKSQQCGWLKDKYGLSWQVVPTRLLELTADAESDASQRATQAMMAMKKIDIAAIERAYEGTIDPR